MANPAVNHKKQVMEAFGTLVSNVQVALGEVCGVTCLPLPPDPRVYVEGDDDPAEVRNNSMPY